MSDWNEVSAIIVRLEAGEGAQIGVAAAEGSALALEVVKWYKFMSDCPCDPGGQMLFLVAYEKWKRGAAEPV